MYWVPLSDDTMIASASHIYSRAFLPSVVWGTVWDPAFLSLFQSFLHSLWRVPRGTPSCLEGNWNDKSPLLMGGNVAVKLAKEYLGVMWHDTERNRIEQSIVLVFQKLEHTWNQWLEFGTPRSNNWATVLVGIVERVWFIWIYTWLDNELISVRKSYIRWFIQTLVSANSWKNEASEPHFRTLVRAGVLHKNRQSPRTDRTFSVGSSSQRLRLVFNRRCQTGVGEALFQQNTSGGENNAPRVINGQLKLCVPQFEPVPLTEPLP